MFKFKQFVIRQDRTAMKVGTDGVLLGAWAPIGMSYEDTIYPSELSRFSMLDLGTGTGLISLMLAQRFPYSHIDAIDIDSDSIEQAAENIRLSPFASRVTTYLSPIQNFSSFYLYDSIVCNPPYFVNSLQCPDHKRTTARHTETLSFDDLLFHSSRLLKSEGSLSVILPVNEGHYIIDHASEYGLYLQYLVYVHPTPNAVAKRLLMHFIKLCNDSNVSAKDRPIESHIAIELSRHVYTPEYIALTRDFYLKM